MSIAELGEYLEDPVFVDAGEEIMHIQLDQPTRPEVPSCTLDD